MLECLKQDYEFYKYYKKSVVRKTTPIVSEVCFFVGKVKDFTINKKQIERKQIETTKD